MIPSVLARTAQPYQPVEHLAALRAIPKLARFPARGPDGDVECWQLALEAKPRLHPRADEAKSSAHPPRVHV